MGLSILVNELGIKTTIGFCLVLLAGELSRRWTKDKNW
jgi:hypothetical protein